MFRRPIARATRAKIVKIDPLYSKAIGDLNNFVSALQLAA